MKRITLLTTTLLLVSIVHAQDIPLSSGSAIVGNTGSTSTQLLYWNGTGAYYGRKLAGMVGVSNHNFRIDGDTKLILNSSGYVGIGTTSPASSLHIHGTGGGTSGYSLSNDYDDVRGYFLNNIDNSSFIFTYLGTNGAEIELQSDGDVILAQEGNVGIGTTSPTKKLEIKGDDGVGIRLFNQAANTWDILNSQYGKLDFVRGSSNIYMRIDQFGKVGIGTTSPNEKLTVEGNIRARGSNDDNSRFIAAGTNGTTAFLGDGGGGSDGQLALYASSGGALSVLLQGTGNSYFNTSGNVGIGTDDPKSKLAVEGQIRATEVKVLADITVPDYVFEPDYELRTLKETKAYITENKHLPEIPSAAEIDENGIDLGDMNMRLLKKIEELTLYQIELMEKLEKQDAELNDIKKVLETLKD